MRDYGGQEKCIASVTFILTLMTGFSHIGYSALTKTRYNVSIIRHREHLHARRQAHPWPGSAGPGGGPQSVAD